jgi:tetratricopeptide (TPR) repeat protein
MIVNITLPAFSEDKNKEAEGHAVNGLTFLSGGDFASAEKELLEAVKLAPKMIDYRKALGIVYEKWTKYDKAVEQYQAALKLKPDDKELNYNLGRVLQYGKNNPEKAKPYYAKYLKLDPKGSLAEEIYFSLGKIYCDEKNYEKASAQYKCAVELKGANQAMAHYYLGLCYIKINKPDLAEKEMVESAKSFPTEATIYGTLGEIYMKKKDFQKAIENYKKAADYDKGNYKYHKDLGLVYEQKGDLDLALEEYKSAMLDNSSDSQVHYLAGAIYDKKSDYVNALEQFRKASELEPNNKIYSDTCAKAEGKVPKATPTQVETPVIPVSVTPAPVSATPSTGSAASVSLTIKILEPEGFLSGYECKGPKVNIVGIATAPAGSGIVEVLIDNVSASLSTVEEQYLSEVPPGGNSLLFKGEALLTLGDNQVKISAMDKTRSRIETVFTIKRLQ